MNKPKQSPPIRAEILDEAAAWLVEFRVGEATAAERREFDAWLRASPEHVRAYLAILPLWENGAHLDREKLPDPATLVDWMRAGGDNVIALEEKSFTREARPAGRRLRMPLALAASAAIVALGTWLHMQRDTYSTGVGEQRSITLADGSIVELNALSRVRVRFAGRQRAVELMDGQALFRVAQDKARPFIVSTGDTKIQAIGTEFDVYRKRRGTTVTVLEGRVVVMPSHLPLADVDSSSGPSAVAPTAGRQEASIAGKTLGAYPVYLSAGEQVSLTPAAAPRTVRADIPAATAWMQRRLIFSGTPLTEVAEEFNRYNARHLVIEDPSLETLRINGVFSSTDPAALLSFLHEQEDIAVVATGREILVGRK